MSVAMTIMEMARVDVSSSTFFMVHSSLAVASIEMCGNQQQKDRFVQKMRNFDLIGCFGLTEPFRGSDASNLQTTAKKVPGGWILNGKKRWIGNGTFADVIIIWAKNLGTGKVNGFIVEKGAKGFSATKIENKISLRVVQK
jgi:alkylation response protein AidB-like acyl-CoA dehydrogenase